MPEPQRPPQQTSPGRDDTQLRVVRRGMRVGAAVGSVQMAGFLMVSASHPLNWSLLPQKVLWALMALCQVAYCVVALRPENRIRTIRQAAVETTLLLGATLAVCSATGPAYIPGQTFTHTSVIAILFGFSFLMPFPFRIGAPAMCLIAAAYPLVQLLYGESEESSLRMAMATVNIALGLGSALFMLAWHGRMQASSQQAERALADIVERDSLTGLLSRASIESHGRRAMYDLNRGRDVVVCVVDIDRFKRFNTDYGYAVGDMVLEEVSRRIVRTIGAHADAWVGRTGGEEFVAVCQTDQVEEVVERVERFLKTMRSEAVRVGEESVTVSASVGVASSRLLERSDWESVLHAADQAMYRAKYRGGQQFSWAEPADVEPASARSRSRGSSRRSTAAAHAGAEWMQRERQRVHTVLMCMVLCLCAVWQPFLILLDLVRVREGMTDIPLAVWAFYRFGCSAVAATAAWYLSTNEVAISRTGWFHALFSVAMILAAVFGAGADGLAMGPFGLCIASVGLIVWSLALALPTWTVLLSSVGLALLYLLSPLVLLPQETWQEMPFIDHVYRVMTVTAVLALAFSSRQHFMALRDEESLIRRELGIRTTIDALTGLPNRRAFQRRLPRAVALVSEERRLSLMLLDIDHFKLINDEHGHAVGDRVLVELGRFLESLVPASALVARLGGEEFAMVLLQSGDHTGLELAQRIVAGVRTLQTDRIRRPVTVSIGVAHWTAGDNEESLMQRADAALRQAKRDGRNRVVVASGSQDAGVATPPPPIPSDSLPF